MRKEEGFLSISIVIIMIFSGMIFLSSMHDDMLPFSIFKDVNASFAGGAGTDTHPYQIINVSQLQNMSSDLTSHYILINDINASATTNWNGGNGFVPIGGRFNKFRGSLNGQRYNITGLFINRTSEFSVGLFGYLSTEGALSNVSLIDENVSGEDSAGSLAGTNYGTISNCYSSGNIHDGGFWVGGLVGTNYGTMSNSYSSGTVNGNRNIGGLVGINDGTVSNCHSSGTVSGDDAIGGLAGTNYGTVSNCYSSGTVSGDDAIGGLVGHNYGTVSDCYSTGSVAGGNQVGILVGYNEGAVSNCSSTGTVSGWIAVGGLVGANFGTMSNCYSSGTVSGDNRIGGLMGSNDGVVSNCYSIGTVSGYDTVGGFVGYNEGNVSNCFWDTNTSGLSNSTGGVGLPTSDMKRSSTFFNASWDLFLTWGIIENRSYPFLKYQMKGPLISINSSQKTFDILEDNEFFLEVRSDSYSIPGCENKIQYSINNSYDWLSITQMGLIVGNPSNDDVGTHIITLEVEDLINNTNSLDITLIVINTNDEPEILPIEISDIYEDSLFFFDIDAVDIDPINDILEWSIITDASFISINSISGNLSGLPLNDDIGTWWVNISVSDGNGGMDWRNITITVLNVNERPTLNVAELTLTMNEDSEGTSLDLNDIFFDIDCDPLSFDHDGSYLLFIAIEGDIATIIPDHNWCGREIIHFTASDGEFSVGFNVTVIVAPINDVPFGASMIARSSYIEGRDQIVNAIAFDVDIPYGDELTFKWTSNISGEIGNGRSINLSLPEGFHLITVTVTDTGGSSIKISKEIEIIAEDTSEVPEDENVNEEYFSILLIVLFILIPLISIIIFFVMRRRNLANDEYEE